MRRSAGHRVTAYMLPPVLLACLLAGSVARQSTPAGYAAAATLSVRAVSPTSDTTEVTAATTIMVAFDRPVVALVGLGERKPPGPLVSNPALAGQGRWLTSSIYTYQAH